MRKQGTLDLQANLPGGFRTWRKRDGGGGLGGATLEAGPCSLSSHSEFAGVFRSKMSRLSAAYRWVLYIYSF